MKSINTGNTFLNLYEDFFSSAYLSNVVWLYFLETVWCVLGSKQTVKPWNFLLLSFFSNLSFFDDHCCWWTVNDIHDMQDSKASPLTQIFHLIFQKLKFLDLSESYLRFALTAIFHPTDQPLIFQKLKKVEFSKSKSMFSDMKLKLPESKNNIILSSTVIGVELHRLALKFNFCNLKFNLSS